MYPFLIFYILNRFNDKIISINKLKVTDIRYELQVNFIFLLLGNLKFLIIVEFLLLFMFSYKKSFVLLFLNQLKFIII